MADEKSRQMFWADGKPAMYIDGIEIWVCLKCKKIKRGKDESDSCCTCVRCRAAERAGHAMRCKECEAIHRREEDQQRHERDMERLDKAIKVETWDSWVFTNQTSHNNGYFESVDALEEYIADEPDVDDIEFAYLTKSKPFRLDIDRALENESDDMWEDFDPENDLEGMKDLRAAVDEFNAKNVGVLSYDADYKRAIAIQRQSAETI